MKKKSGSLLVLYVYINADALNQLTIFQKLPVVRVLRSASGGFIFFSNTHRSSWIIPNATAREIVNFFFYFFSKFEKCFYAFSSCSRRSSSHSFVSLWEFAFGSRASPQEALLLPSAFRLVSLLYSTECFFLQLPRFSFSFYSFYFFFLLLKTFRRDLFERFLFYSSYDRLILLWIVKKRRPVC